jgi:hypothetical protein
MREKPKAQCADAEVGQSFGTLFARVKIRG